MNRVEVFSTASHTRIAQISVPGASSADLSADGATIWIGTALNEIVAVDPASFSVTNRYSLTGLMPIPNVTFDRPAEVLSLPNGKSMLRLRQPVSSEALLALWDPGSNSLTDLTPTAPAVFQQGVGVLARSGDHSKVLAAANDSSGELALFDFAGNVVAGPSRWGPAPFRVSLPITMPAASPLFSSPAEAPRFSFWTLRSIRLPLMRPPASKASPFRVMEPSYTSRKLLRALRWSPRSTVNRASSSAESRTSRFKAPPRESMRPTKPSFSSLFQIAVSASSMPLRQVHCRSRRHPLLPRPAWSPPKDQLPEEPRPF